MTINHSDVSVGDRVYSPHHSRVFVVSDKDRENLLLSPIGGNDREPKRLVSAIQGIHWGLQSWQEYKSISKMVDQLNARRSSLF